MNIITIFNYPDREIYNTMYKIWLTQVLKCKTNTPSINKIKVLTLGLSAPLIEFTEKLNKDFIHIENKKYSPHSFSHKSGKWKHNVGFKLFNLCNEKEPYVFIDIDAIIFNVNKFSDVIEAGKDKPLIGVDHQTIPRHTEHFNYKFMNTGFLIVSDPSFLNFEKILSTPIIFSPPGTDQFLINNYCKYINYDYTHPRIHYGWNACAGYKKVLGDKIISHGIKENHEIYILHYWYEFKPWIKTCFLYNKVKDELLY